MTTTERAPAASLTVTGVPRWEPGGPPPEQDEATLLTISPDGSVTVYSGKVDYGQGIRSGFALEVADELDVDPSDVTVVLGDTALVPYDRGTTGSASTRTVGMQFRRAAATARAHLIQLAASRLEADPGDISTAGGQCIVTGQPGRSVSYADLLSGQEITAPVSDDAQPKQRENFNVMGRAARRTDAVGKVTGRARYSRDLALPGMLHGKIVRPPSNGATLDRIDAARAERVPGVVSIVQEDSFVGVVAEREDIAEYAVGIIRSRWNEVPDTASDWDLPALLKEHAKEPVSLREEGNLQQAFDSADHVIEGVYYAPYIANSQMEPSAALASWDGDQLTVWCGNRAPFQERDQLATFFGVPLENVRVIAAEVGGSFGTKTATVGLEAARLSRAVGRPVRLAYSRAEEFAWSTVRPAALMEIRSGFNDDGDIVAWDYIAYHAGENAFRGRRGADTPYDTQNVRISVANSITPLTSGSYRSLGGAVNHFAREAHIDEIASRLGMDPLALRLRNLSHPRMRRALELAASRFGWSSREKSPHRGFGLAVGYDASSYAAECVELTVESGDVKVNRVVAGFDCGLVVNPEGAANQVEGSIMMGIGNALWESIEFDGGRVLNPGYGHYRVPRISDTPDIQVEFVDNPDEPSTGTGEPGLVPVAGAIANAVRDATGVAIDRLPIVPDLR